MTDRASTTWTPDVKVLYEVRDRWSNSLGSTSTALMTDKYLQILSYRDFHDVPRLFVVEVQDARFVFDCPFDEALDEYGDSYTVYRIQAGDDDPLGDWASRPAAALVVGRIPVADIEFDPTHREAIEASCIRKLLSGRGANGDSGAEASSPLIGTWVLVRTESDDDIGKGVTMEILEDGQLTYSIDQGDSIQIMKLVYRVEGDTLVTDQPSIPWEHSTRFWFEQEMLVLEDEGRRSWFKRNRQ